MTFLKSPLLPFSHFSYQLLNVEVWSFRLKKKLNLTHSSMWSWNRIKSSFWGVFVQLLWLPGGLGHREVNVRVCLGSLVWDDAGSVSG